MSFESDSPPTSKEEAAARRVRPPSGKYDPDSLSHWSITMMVAWIIWGEIDAVRNEWDSYRSDCADWLFFRSGSTARKKFAGDPDPQKGSWEFCQWKASGWTGLRSRARSRNIPPQVAIDSLWLAGGEARIKATALEYENAKAFVGNPIEIPAHYWPHLKCANDPLSGKAILSGPDGRVYREVQFPRLDGKRLWPKSLPLSGEPTAEKLQPKAWLAWACKEYPKQRAEQPTAYIRRLHGLMEKADNVTKAWKLETFRLRYYEAIKVDQ